MMTLQSDSCSWDDEKGKSFYVAYAKEKGFKELDRIGEKGKTILYKAE